jgi:hypothetical protein
MNFQLRACCNGIFTKIKLVILRTFEIPDLSLPGLVEKTRLLPNAGLGPQQNQCSGFGFQDLGFADTWHLKPETLFPINQVV